MLLRDRQGVQVEWYKNPDKQWLANAWRDLENRANANFFLSWLWIGTWLDCFVTDFHLIEATQNSKTVGLGIIVTKRHACAPNWWRKQHFLHRTGSHDEDQIWIEYNDFLIANSDAHEIRDAMCASMQAWIGPNDTFVVGASLPEKFAPMTSLGVAERTVWETKNYFLELSSLREKKQDLLQVLSRNSRYQISRSLREYQQVGAVTVTTMTTVHEALALFEAAKPLHLARWGNSSNGSGMVNPKFVAFHEKLIAKGMNSGHIELHHVQAGDETIGIIYNFHYRGVVYFYLGAMNYCHSSPHFKPGLVSHYLLINKAIKDGVNVYDFMGGEARYKSTFANQEGCLVVSRYGHPSAFLSVENFAREIKHRL
ncbi:MULTISPECIES: GNAT family N-acetyltransferase [Vibrio]|uniref:GNAT family N-acetyltransferase n=2 Tax=Vibrio TaxID=662 RepID=A0A7X4RWD1_9VIBR|nr:MULTISPECIES: GNAT family N-acetyltransferase [Vibrio]MBF9002137.1 GNAT family N-acetyltransferase [Vibrio nitrifigilis]MZI95558.1 GNAT family N-acetyltransferase [Vibrio eleionomae]